MPMMSPPIIGHHIQCRRPVSFLKSVLGAVDRLGHHPCRQTDDDADSGGSEQSDPAQLRMGRDREQRLG